MKLTLGKQALLVVAPPLLVEIAVVVTIAYMVHDVGLEQQRKAQTRDLSYEVNSLIMTFRKHGKFVLLDKMSSSEYTPVLEEEFKHERVPVSKRLDTIERLVRDNPGQQELLNQIRSKKDEFNGLMREATQAANQESAREAATSNPRAQEILEEVLALAERMNSLQARTERKEQDAQGLMRMAIVSTLIALVVASLLVALRLTQFFRRSALSRLARLTESISLLADGKTLGQSQSGTDEIAALDSAIRQISQEFDLLRQKDCALIDGAADVICTLDNLGRFVSLNSSVERVWGYTAGELTGVELSTILLDEDPGQTLTALQNAAQRPNVLIETRIKQKSGITAHMQWSVRRDQDRGSLYCVVRDVTAKAEVEQLKSLFLSMISHDLRTPLTSIQLAHELFIDGAYGELDDKGVEELERADAEIDQLLELVSQFLDIEKCEASALELVCEPTEIGSAIDAAVKSVRTLSRKLGVRVKVVSNKALTVPIDESRVAQVLTILLTNAFNSSSKGEVVSVKCSRYSNSLKVCVCDIGPSIPVDLRESIFDRFAGKQPMPGRCGTGLGLALCAAVVNLHGGEIGVESSEGFENIFWFTLPLNSPESDSQ